MPFANRDAGESVQEPTHRLRGALRCRVADAACDHHGAPATATSQSGGAEELGEPGEEADGRGRAERSFDVRRTVQRYEQLYVNNAAPVAGALPEAVLT